MLLSVCHYITLSPASRMSRRMPPPPGFIYHQADHSILQQYPFSSFPSVNWKSPSIYAAPPTTNPPAMPSLPSARNATTIIAGRCWKKIHKQMSSLSMPGTDWNFSTEGGRTLHRFTISFFLVTSDRILEYTSPRLTLQGSTQRKQFRGYLP